MIEDGEKAQEALLLQDMFLSRRIDTLIRKMERRKEAVVLQELKQKDFQVQFGSIKIELLF